LILSLAEAAQVGATDVAAAQAARPVAHLAVVLIQVRRSICAGIRHRLHRSRGQSGQCPRRNHGC
jgi:hypothetical protein